ncbi:MAG: hypothetical protein ACK6D7_19665, partial [Acidobacteriota bacterium]
MVQVVVEEDNAQAKGPQPGSRDQRFSYDQGSPKGSEMIGWQTPFDRNARPMNRPTSLARF